MKAGIQNESEDNWPLGLCTLLNTRHNQPDFYMPDWNSPKSPTGVRDHWNPEFQKSPGIPQRHSGPAAATDSRVHPRQEPEPLHLNHQDTRRKI